MPAFTYSGNISVIRSRRASSRSIFSHVEKGNLTAENNVFLDQLTFGEKIESPDALAIPVRLAVALLKHRHGEINLHLR